MELASNIFMSLLFLWIFICFLSWGGLRFIPKIKKKQDILKKYYQNQIKRHNLNPKTLSFFSLGWVVFNGVTKRISINSFFLLFSIKSTKKRLKRELRRQKIYEGKSNPDFFLYLLGFRQRGFWILFLIIWGNIILVYINQLQLPKEQLEMIRSLLMFPSNILILISLYQRFFSTKRKLIRKELIKELNS